MAVTACPDAVSAEAIARSLVERGLAACVNVLPRGRSFYIWQDRLECSEEQLLLIKIKATVYAEVEQAIQALHPYELPEVIAVPIVAGSQKYLDWINERISHHYE